ncbi:NAD(P)H dehydrogenase (quinone) [Terribacillus aidingensis]|uniref:NAD(P)H dehydrogenase (Quinone) n=1 Tax=Terribacillus aidingensis TaxID=586416 RepID=A0A285P3I8_9BACI|nr:NAD(P)H-dependent oxidoreductase [Terribacillus aidingensis]SNZ16295.1 NAD(P)H dehydrogenase (quinone) [Terribacillus aidingensis]
MRALLIYAHPNHRSLNYAFFEAAQKGMQQNAAIHEIDMLDLYAEKFDPVLVFHENKRRRDMHKDPELEVYRKKIKQADLLVFVYPIFWGRPPAMLLGFIDQVFAANFAYRHDSLLPEGLLAGKRAVCVSTMKGPRFYSRFFLHNAHKVLMKKALFQFVGIRKVKLFEFGGMEKKNGKQQKYLDQTAAYFRKLAK